jgi:hypothetical protein
MDRPERGEVDDGELHRVLRDLQREHFSTPEGIEASQPRQLKGLDRAAR